jgi:hypothetical protein
VKTPAVVAAVVAVELGEVDVVVLVAVVDVELVAVELGELLVVELVLVAGAVLEVVLVEVVVGATTVGVEEAVDTPDPD